MATNKPIDIMIVGGNYIGKGAEAMMLVVRDEIHARVPSARFWVVPTRPEDVPKHIADGFNVIYKKPSSRLVKLVELLCGLVGIRRRRKQGIASGDSVANVFRATNWVVDVSGFASSDQIGPLAAMWRCINYLRALYAGNRIIFMPQSWGPFQNGSVRRYTRVMLKRASVIFAREQDSYKNLIEAGCVEPDKVSRSRDIAFLFAADDAEKTAASVLEQVGLGEPIRPYIAITPNMRIYERCKGDNENNEYIRILSEVIRFFIDQTDRSILLISHEASHNRRNDRELCLLLKNIIGTPGRLVMLGGEENARQIKAVVGKAEFLVASRYHSLVAALSMRTPVAVIGWSHKYDDLMAAVGLSEYVVDPVRGQEMADMSKAVVKAYAAKTDISRALEQHMPDIENGVEAVFDMVAEKVYRE